jgi:hypothetical protein
MHKEYIMGIGDSISRSIADVPLLEQTAIKMVEQTAKKTSSLEQLIVDSILNNIGEDNA